MKEIKLTDKDCLDKSIETLTGGGVVALATDTIYGIACLVDNTKALKRIYKIKNRDNKKPLAVCVGNIAQLQDIVETNINEELLLELLPGPVTLVFKRRNSLNKSLNPSIQTIGVRIPNNKFIQDLTNRVGPIALTSANLSGEQSCLEIGEFKHIWVNLDLVVDSGRIKDNNESRLGSTIIDLTEEDHFKILRDGCALEKSIEILEKYELVRSE